MKSVLPTSLSQAPLTAKPTEGHRQRLRDRFLLGEDRALTEEGLIELLLTFAIPQKDVRPLAVALLKQFRSIQAILNAPPETLRQVSGVGDTTIVLIKLVEHLAGLDHVTPKTAEDGSPRCLRSIKSDSSQHVTTSTH